jgi:hypothetical protein
VLRRMGARARDGGVSARGHTAWVGMATAAAGWTEQDVFLVARGGMGEWDEWSSE